MGREDESPAMSVRSALGRRAGIGLAVSLVVLAAGSGVVAASNVAAGLSGGGSDVSVPTWLYLATGGGTVGASALLTMLVTDRDVIGSYHDRGLEASVDRLLSAGSLLLGVVGVLGLGLIVVAGIAGPNIGLVSATVLVTFVGGRALLTIVTYTVGNPWPALNPWRRIAEALPTIDEPYPDAYRSWPAVVALLVFVWLEIVAPLTSSPRALLLVLLMYSMGTISSAVVFSPATWFRRGDPLALWFRLYGAVAPIQRTDDGFELRYPGSRLSEADLVVDGSLVAFVLALVWELTFSGFIVTPVGVGTIETLVGIGLPPALVYLGLLVVGFALFWKIYWLAIDRTRERAETYLSREYLGLRLAAPLLAIAAGYHFAHYVGFGLSLWPSLLDAIAMPLNPPPNPTRYALPGWFGYVEIAGILLGHVLAVWVAHTVSFELFPGKLQAIRSQYPLIVVMVFFTMASLYLVSQGTMSPPYVPS
ncbi:hypothetical protein KWG76_13625 [Haloterrigena longa]|uniref:Uncharacterized protein n=2 Tax=Natrinema longum TaxID=370324 RepID=A0A8A2UD23_9EURY|nr:hypothetical protein [Natrinema longum]MBZ6495955.1 hypothetical protein [Natrinema longum]QSW86105.1 hypothetical protein J0X27_04600 [Natrinema longum]